MEPMKAPEPAKTPRPGDAQPKAPAQKPYEPGDSNAKPEKK